MQDRIITIHLFHLPPLMLRAIEDALQAAAGIALFAGGNFLFQSQPIKENGTHATDTATDQQPRPEITPAPRQATPPAV